MHMHQYMCMDCIYIYEMMATLMVTNRLVNVVEKVIIVYRFRRCRLNVFCCLPNDIVIVHMLVFHYEL